MIAILVALVIAFGLMALYFALRDRREAPQKVHLPVARDPGAKCGSCVHFDLAEGQARMRRDLPVFSSLVAPFISPSEYKSAVTAVAPNAEGILENKEETPAADIPASCDWRRFGYCMKHNDCLWEGTTSANRIKNMADLTPGGVDCHEPRLFS